MKTIFKILGALLLLVIGIGIGKFALAPKATETVAPSFFDGGEANGEKSQIIQGETIEVKDGESIQAAVAKAKPGDVIMVFPGTYSETVYIDKDNIRFYGVIENGKRPTLDGKKELNDAFLYSGNGITIENFKIVDFKGNAIMGQAGNNFIIRNNLIENTGVYGIFPQYGKNGLVELNKVSGIEDAAIYIGMCDNIDVRNNEVFESVAGIEIENSRHCLVENNYVHDNTGGLLAFITPGLPIKDCYDVIFRENFVINNNHDNFGAPGSVVATIPPGTGLLVLAADEVTVEDNFFIGNKSFAIAVTDLDNAEVKFSTDEGIDQFPDKITILDNYMENNGYDPSGIIKKVRDLAFKKSLDIGFIGGGNNNCILNRGRYVTLGLESFANCEPVSTKEVKSYMLANPVEPRDVSIKDKGKLAFYGICAGCHSFNNQIVGPEIKAIQAIYKNNPQGIVDYINKPIHKRPDYPEMPSQKHLPEDVKQAVAKYMLQVGNEKE
ncbi:MAG: parallel beta-helix domain-containing protein [Chitinophagales bacterium]